MDTRACAPSHARTQLALLAVPSLLATGSPSNTGRSTSGLPRSSGLAMTHRCARVHEARPSYQWAEHRAHARCRPSVWRDRSHRPIMYIRPNRDARATPCSPALEHNPRPTPAEIRGTAGSLTGDGEIMEKSSGSATALSDVRVARPHVRAYA